MADVLLLRRRARRRIARLNRYWSLKDVKDPFQMRNTSFRERFRLSKRTAKGLCSEISNVLQAKNLLHPNGYPLELQVLNTLRVLGSGSFQNVIADGGILAEINQSTISRHMTRVLDAIIDLRHQYIRFPTGNEIPVAAADFYADLSFPNTIGAIDCTHVVIIRPATSDWFTYINRHGDFSINVQMVVNSKMKFLDVVPRWPGGSHDAFIWRMSNLRNRFTGGNSIPTRTFLLGDSGYPLEPWLMTPYPNSTSVAREQLYNRKHRRARNVVERAFGLLKNRFRCLHSTGGDLLYPPAKICKMILACAILHNLCIGRNDEWDDDSSDETVPAIEEAVPDWGTQGTVLRDVGIRYRDELAIHFSRNRH